MRSRISRKRSDLRGSARGLGVRVRCRPGRRSCLRSSAWTRARASFRKPTFTSRFTRTTATACEPRSRELSISKTGSRSLGHTAGDQLIVSTAGVIRARLRESDTLARLGGDEFAVLLPTADQQEAASVAQGLADAVRRNIVVITGERKSVTTSIGVAMFDGHAERLTGEAVLIEADLAMYDAKEAGRDHYAFSATAEHRTSHTRARLTWVNRIEHALANDGFALLAQPILDLQTHRVRQHELLLRMLDQEGELIPPAAFLTIAERFGLISDIDEWVVTHAIELIEQYPKLQLEVNISGVSLGDAQLLQSIETRLERSRINPSRLIFEVTETAAVANITHAQTFAQRLRNHGCRFALDDFGAGFGSFYYLKHLPFDYVKIDGEFVQHAANGHIDQLVIEAVVRIAQGLGKETIAEFVTDERTQRIVTRLGVDYAQGYYIGRPVPIDALLQTLRSPRSRTDEDPTTAPAADG
jgi:diguanylate cyclase (GGDEF)-like protein